MITLLYLLTEYRIYFGSVWVVKIFIYAAVDIKPVEVNYGSLNSVVNQRMENGCPKEIHDRDWKQLWQVCEAERTSSVASVSVAIKMLVVETVHFNWHPVNRSLGEKIHIYTFIHEKYYF